MAKTKCPDHVHEAYADVKTFWYYRCPMCGDVINPKAPALKGCEKCHQQWKDEMGYQYCPFCTNKTKL